MNLIDNPDNYARRGIAQLALKGFFSVANRWKLNRTEAMNLLGLTATSTYANWKNGKPGTIPRDTLERISYILHIDETLRHFLDDEAANSWLKIPNPAPVFESLSPLERMLQGNVVDVYTVSQHVPNLLRSLERQTALIE